MSSSLISRQQVLDSIGQHAPRLRLNDSHLMSPDVWWTIVSDDRDPGSRQMVHGTTPLSDGLLWFGGALCLAGLVGNSLVLVSVLVGVCQQRRRINTDGPHHWLLLNHIVVMLATATLVVPVTVYVERYSSGWQWGSQACRVWLLGRLVLSAATFWSGFALVFDRFLAVAAPYAYSRWAVDGGSGRTCAVWMAVLGTWLAAGLALVPTWISLKRDDFVLEEVCAANLSASNVVFVTMSSFAVPATLTLLVSFALLLARRRSLQLVHDHCGLNCLQVVPDTSGSKLAPESMLDHISMSVDTSSSSYSNLVPGLSACLPSQLVHDPTDADCYKFQADYRRFTPTTTAAVATDNHDYDVIEEPGSRGALTQKRHVTACCVSCVDAVLCALVWTPFYSSGVAAALCGAILCVDPGLWSLFSWLGYTSVCAAPLVWLLGDSLVRAGVRRLLVPCGRRQDEGRVPGRESGKTGRPGSLGGSATLSSALSYNSDVGSASKRFDVGSTL